MLERWIKHFLGVPYYENESGIERLRIKEEQKFMEKFIKDKKREMLQLVASCKKLRESW